MTGSLQVKNGKFYMIINDRENGKRKQKWIATGLDVRGNQQTLILAFADGTTTPIINQSAPE